jgi:hypothetical protein
LLISAAAACTNEKPFDITKAKWEAVDSLPFLQYCVAGKHTAGDASNAFSFYGWERDGKILTDSAHGLPASIGENIQFIFTESKAYKELRRKTEGFIKLDLSADSLQIKGEQKQFALFYNKEPSKARMDKDSSSLASMNLFELIEVIDQDDIRALWSADGDNDWLKILEENPMPVSIDLRLNHALRNSVSTDSVEAVLRKRFPDCDVVYRDLKDPNYIDPSKGKPVFKFIVQ